MANKFARKEAPAETTKDDEEETAPFKADKPKKDPYDDPNFVPAIGKEIKKIREAKAKAKASGKKLKIADKPSKTAKKSLKPSKKELASKAGPDTRKITLVTKENPKREGTESYKRFELYKKAKTVQAFLDAGGTAADVRFDTKAGHIKVS